MLSLASSSTMADPSTPTAASSIFGGPPVPAPASAPPPAFDPHVQSIASSSTNSTSTSLVLTPASGASSSGNTYIMPSSPSKARPTTDGYRPRVIRTLGQRPACLVNASVTYCGNNQIFAFGGFDQYTDEVYNHVLKLDLASYQWSLVDNYGDIPGVRMGRPL